MRNKGNLFLTVACNYYNKYRRMMELENHQWMLKLGSKNWLRNKTFSLKASLHRERRNLANTI